MSRRKLYVRLVVSILKRRENKTDFLSTVPEQYRWPWIGLIAAAGDSPVKGKVCIQEGLPFHAEQLSRLLDTSHLKDALKCFEKLDMISYDKNGIIIINHYEIYQSEWERLQKYLTDKELPTPLPTPLPTHLPNTNAVILPSITLSKEVSSSSVIDFSNYMQTWNLSGYPKIKEMTADRKAKLKTRLKDPDYDFDKIIETAKKSNDFIQKYITFDWITENDKNWRKITEGNYLKQDNADKNKVQFMPEVL